jgi:XTP/dITP diphosphohydrolase
MPSSIQNQPSAQKIVLATGNPGKVTELAAMLAPWGCEIVPQTSLGVSDADETGLTFIENAILKARHAAAITGLPAIADDSGLAVDALGGAPGIYSARFAGLNATDADNVTLLLEKMAAVPQGQRQAQFHCVLVYLRHANDPTPLISHGIWQGEIALASKGQHGFGYDPIFWLPELGVMSAELEKSKKAQLSHRGKALAHLQQQWQQHNNTGHQ